MGLLKLLRFNEQQTKQEHRESKEGTRKLWRFVKREKRQAWSGMKYA